jgi:hypothetical protein
MEALDQGTAHILGRDEDHGARLVWPVLELAWSFLFGRLGIIGE